MILITSWSSFRFPGFVCPCKTIVDCSYHVETNHNKSGNGINMPSLMYIFLSE